MRISGLVYPLTLAVVILGVRMGKSYEWFIFCNVILSMFFSDNTLSLYKILFSVRMITNQKFCSFREYSFQEAFSCLFKESNFEVMN